MISWSDFSLVCKIAKLDIRNKSDFPPLVQQKKMGALAQLLNWESSLGELKATRTNEQLEQCSKAVKPWCRSHFLPFALLSRPLPPCNLDGRAQTCFRGVVFSFRLPDSSAVAAENWTSAAIERPANECAPLATTQTSSVWHLMRRCPFSSLYCSLANLNDLNSPCRPPKECQVNYAVGQLFCEETENKTHRGRTGQSRGSAIHKNDFVSNSASGWCEHRTTGQVCAQAYVCACKCVRGGNKKKLWKRWRREIKGQTGGLRTENIADYPLLMSGMDSTSMPILFWSCK